MREILFRGKRLDNGEWVEGCFGQHTSFDALIIRRPYPTINGELSALGFHEIDPSTVGQYTGLTDKNGKKIFEGDIVCFCEENQLPCCCVIKYGEYSFGHIGFYTDWYKGGSTVKYFRKDLGFWVKHGKIEVTGNIHDNPELLEDEG